MNENAIDKFTNEIWTQEEADIYWEWAAVWIDPDFDWENELTPVGEDILAKAERIGPPPEYTRVDVEAQELDQLVYPENWREW